MERNVGLLKRVDRYVGVPLLFLIGLLRLKRNKPEVISSVGIFAFAAIGDSILSSSLLISIRNKYPAAKIIVFCSKANAAIYSLIEGFDQLVILPITDPLKACRLLRLNNVDILIDTSQWFRLGALYTWIANPKWSIGFQTRNQNRHYAYDVAVQHSDQIHERENFHALLSPLNCISSASLAIRKDLKNLELYKLSNINSPYVVLHPWASGTNSVMREWPEKNWIDLANRLAQAGLKILISGSSVDKSRAQDLVNHINLGNVVAMVAGKVSLGELANLLLHANACVSVNTGIAHLSAALEVPTVVLNGPTNSRRWGIQGGRVMNLDVSKGQGGAFLNLGFEYPPHHPYIMEKISVQMVINALMELEQLDS